jgi:hypothetical protein
MRRSVTFSLAWLCAAGAATFAAGQGVAVVTHAVTSDRPSALTASQVETKVGADAAASTSTTVAAGTGGSTTTTAPPASTTTTTTTTAPVASVPVTYTVVGGTVTFRVSPTEVTMESASPNSGFSVTSEPENENGFDGLRVQFESESHRSRVTAWWDNGPQHRDREDNR